MNASPLRYQFRQLKDSELGMYSSHAKAALGVEFPTDYLRQGKVFGLFTKTNKLVGGFALITKGPFRSMQSIPDLDLVKIGQQHKLDNIFELNGLWMDSKVPYAAIRSIFWFNLLKQLLLIGKNRFVFTVSEDGSSKLLRTYSSANPQILFRGATKILPGMSKPENEIVAIGSVFSCLASLAIQPSFLPSRMRLAERMRSKVRNLREFSL